jgi:DNA-binding XRE family transcriptional regulator
MQKLRQTRKAAGLNKSQLARIVGSTQPTISNIEEGRNSPSLDLSLRIAAALGTTVDDLAGQREGAAAM